MGLKNKLWNRHKKWHFLKANAQARIYLVCLIQLVKASNVSLLKVSIMMEKMNISFDRVKNVIWSCLIYLNIDETKNSFTSICIHFQHTHHNCTMVFHNLSHFLFIVLSTSFKQVYHIVLSVTLQSIDCNSSLINLQKYLSKLLNKFSSIKH